MTDTDLTADQARRELYETMREDTDFEAKVDRALDLGKTYLGVDNAHLTRIHPDADYWEAIASTDTPDDEFPPGLVLDYTTTYCRRVLADGGSITLHDAPNQGWADDAAFEEHGLHCYHGTPIYVDDEPYGTVCFVSEQPREAPFDTDDTLFAELVARLLEHELEHQRHQAETTRRSNAITVLSRVLRHNLRNEMCIVRGEIGVLADQLEDASVEEAVFDGIDRVIALSDKARKLETVVSTDYDHEFVALAPLLERIQTAVRLDYPDATITIDVPEGLSADLKPSFELAVIELLENAAEHAGPDAHVTVTAEETPGGVTLEVSDDGPGLPSQECQVLSEGVETPLVHGSGLGLWMVYWIVTSHDGTITATTDGGTTVSIRIPKAKDQDPLPGDEVPVLQGGLDRFEAVFEQSFDAMVILDDDRRIIDANDHAATLFGAPTDALLGRRIDEYVAEGFDIDAAWTALQSVGRHEDQVTVEPGDGPERVVEFSAAADIVPGQHLIVGRDVTERISRERELETVNSRLDAIFNNTHTFVGLLDPDGTVIEANETALSFGGLDRETVVGQPFWATPWHAPIESTRAAVRAAVERARDGEFVREELRVQGADGEAVVDFSLRPLRDEEGQVTLLVAEGREITDRVEAETELAAEQQFTRSLLESLPDPVYAFAPDGSLTRWNDEFEAVTGYSSDELDGRYVTEFIPEDEQATIVENFQAIVDERRSVTVESAFETRAGERIPYEFTGGPIETEDGDLRGVTGVGRDISDRKQLEQRLRDERERFEQLLDTSPVGITILDQDGTIVRANQRAEEVLGLEASTMTGRRYDDPDWNIVDSDGENVPADELPFAQVVETGQPVYDVEHGIEWPDGTERWLSINAAPLTDETGAIDAVVAVITDSTSQRAHEERIERQNERLDAFTGIVSHDLRNPLNVAEGHLELAREDTDNEHLKAVARAHERIRLLIEDMLALAQSGAQVADQQALELEGIIERCWRNVETADATLVVEENRRLWGDESRLRQVFENLFRNAIEHGGEDVTVRVGAMADGFYVEDDGPGIPQRERDDVFAAGHSTSPEGTGFGLSIVKEVVEAHGWALQVIEGADGGARFEITGVTDATEPGEGGSDE